MNRRDFLKGGSMASALVLPFSTFALYQSAKPLDADCFVRLICQTQLGVELLPLDQEIQERFLKCVVDTEKERVLLFGPQKLVFDFPGGDRAFVVVRAELHKSMGLGFPMHVAELAPRSFPITMRGGHISLLWKDPEEPQRPLMILF